VDGEEFRIKLILKTNKLIRNNMAIQVFRYEVKINFILSLIRIIDSQEPGNTRFDYHFLICSTN